jgi:hypothetical protein
MKISKTRCHSAYAISFSQLARLLDFRAMLRLAMQARLQACHSSPIVGFRQRYALWKLFSDAITEKSKFRGSPHLKP